MPRKLQYLGQYTDLPKILIIFVQVLRFNNKCYAIVSYQSCTDKNRDSNLTISESTAGGIKKRGNNANRKNKVLEVNRWANITL